MIGRYLLWTSNDEEASCGDAWYDTFQKKHQFQCEHDDYDAWVSPLIVSEDAANVPMSGVNELTEYTLVRGELLDSLRPELESFLKLGKVIHEDEGELTDVKVLWARRRVRIRGGPESSR